MSRTRLPRGPLRPFVRLLWFSDSAAGAFERERLLPTGAMHVAVRLTDAPLRVAGGDGGLVDVGHAVVGGARSSYYVRDISSAARSIGAQLFPGASMPLLGVPANELAERHVTLDDIWGPAASELRERLIAAASPDAALDLFEAALAERLPQLRGIDPIIAHAVTRFETPSSIAAVVAETGYSHRHFITRFRHAVGLTPKRYCRIRRVHRVLSQLASNRPWAAIALTAGYSDQAHLSREFSELAGMSPTRFLRLSPDAGLHVPITPDEETLRANSFKTPPPDQAKVTP